MTEQQMITSTEAFTRLDRLPFGEMPLDDALARIAEVARQVVPGVDEVSVTLLGPAGAHTAAFTGKEALELDEWQYERGHGPCLAAAAAAITVGIPDTAADARWAGGRTALHARRGPGGAQADGRGVAAHGPRCRGGAGRPGGLVLRELSRSVTNGTFPVGNAGATRVVITWCPIRRGRLA
jgi:hypothetical protein